MKNSRPISSSPGSRSVRKRPSPLTRSGSNKLNLNRSSRKISKGTRHELAITPEVAATVVRQYLLPLFESENSSKGFLLALPELRSELNRPLEVVSNTVYGELKLSDMLLTEYSQIKTDLDSVTQKLKDAEQEKSSVLSELNQLKKQYQDITGELNQLQDDMQESLKAEQLEDLYHSFQQNQFDEYKKMFANSTAELKQYQSDLHEEKALNDKRKNISAELENANELLRMENDIMAEKLTGLYAEFKSLADRRFLEDKLIEESDTLALSLRELAHFCNFLSGQLSSALKDRDSLRLQHEEIERLTSEIREVRDRLLSYSRDAIGSLQKELAVMVEQREELKGKQSALEKNYKDLADAYDKLRSRLKQWKQRGKHLKEQEEKVCSKCRRGYSERENYNWSCRTHAGTYSAANDIWWCCGKKKKDAPGCIPAKHVTKDEDEEEDEITQKKEPVCSCCKAVGHTFSECPKDPNVRTLEEPTHDIERIETIKRMKKTQADAAEINDRMMDILGERFGDIGFGIPEVSSCSEAAEDELKDIQKFKQNIRKP